MRTERILYLRNVFFWMLCFVAIVDAQSPGSKPQQPTNSKTFRVAGMVVSAADGHALARANISLTDTKNPQNKQLTSSSETGHFEFNRVAKGKYSLVGTKRGFISLAYNQHEQFSTAIVTGADVLTDDLRLQLPPAAVLSVRVTDETSEPVRKASVMLYREDRTTGIRRIISFNGSSTDDLGSCEFAHLSPGVYFVGVTAKPWYAVHPATMRADGQDDPSASEVHSFDVAYPPTYYGDTMEPDSATPITAKGGDQLQAEIHLSPVPALHLVFHAADDGSQGIRMPMLQEVGFDGTELKPMTEIRNVSAGIFEMVGLSPGKYKARWPGSSPVEVDIATDGQNLNEVRGEAFSTISASVRVLGEPKLPQPLYLRLRAADGNNGAQAKVDDKGKASFANVSPGKYNVFAMTFGTSGVKPYSVWQISSEGNVTPGTSLNVPAGSSLTVSLSLVSGMVNVEGFAKRAGKAAPGVMIVLVPKDPDENRDLFRRDQSDLDGSFSLQGVVPGSYTVVAIEDGWDMDWSLPSVIEPYAKNGQAVIISDLHEHSVKLPEAIEVQPHR